MPSVKYWYKEGFDAGAAAKANGATLEDAPEPLSGEWAGESIPEIFGSWDEATDEKTEAYEEGFYDALAGKGAGEGGHMTGKWAVY